MISVLYALSAAPCTWLGCSGDESATPGGDGGGELAGDGDGDGDGDGPSDMVQGDLFAAALDGSAFERTSLKARPRADNRQTVLSSTSRAWLPHSPISRATARAARPRLTSRAATCCAHPSAPRAAADLEPAFTR